MHDKQNKQNEQNTRNTQNAQGKPNEQSLPLNVFSDWGQKVRVRLMSGMTGILLIFVLFISVHVPSVQAFWGDAIPAAYLKQAMEVAHNQIQGAILGAQKALSASVLYEQIMNSIAGSGGEVRFVTDVDGFLRQSAVNEAQLVVKDWITQMTRGMNNCGYTSVRRDPRTGQVQQSGGSVCGLVGELANVNFSRNYLDRAASTATNYIFGELNAQKMAILNEACPTNVRQNMFAEGNLRCFNTFLRNNTWDFTLEAKEQYDSAVIEIRRQSEAKFIAFQGFLPSTTERSSSTRNLDPLGNVVQGVGQGIRNIGSKIRSDQITTPGSLIKEITAQATNIGTQFAAGTSSPSEFVGYLAGAYINRMIMNVVNDGVGKVKSVINREVKQVQETLNDARREIERNIGPIENFVPLY